MADLLLSPFLAPGRVSLSSISLKAGSVKLSCSVTYPDQVVKRVHTGGFASFCPRPPRADGYPCLMLRFTSHLPAHT